MNYFTAGFDMLPSFCDWLQQFAEGDNFDPNNPGNPGAQFRYILNQIGLEAAPGVNSVYITVNPI